MEETLLIKLENKHFKMYVEPQMFKISSSREHSLLKEGELNFINNVYLAPSQMCLIFTMTGKVTQVRNKHQVFGFGQEDIHLKNLVQDLHPEDSTDFFIFLGMALNHEVEYQTKSFEIEYGLSARILKTDGNYTNMRLTLSTFTQNKRGHPVSVFVIISDIGKRYNDLPRGLTINRRSRYVKEKNTKIFSRDEVKFTKREREVMALLVQGCSSKMVGEELGIAKNTVDVFRKKLLKKTNCGNCAELVSKAIIYCWV